MLGTSLLTKILANFLFGLYLLNSLLNHAANLIQDRCVSYCQPHILALSVFANTQVPTLKKPKELKFPNARIEYSN